MLTKHRRRCTINKRPWLLAVKEEETKLPGPTSSPPKKPLADSQLYSTCKKRKKDKSTLNGSKRGKKEKYR